MNGPFDCGVDVGVVVGFDVGVTVSVAVAFTVGIDVAFDVGVDVVIATLGLGLAVGFETQPHMLINSTAMITIPKSAGACFMSSSPVCHRGVKHQGFLKQVRLHLFEINVAVTGMC
jgi:hypothetical protein